MHNSWQENEEWKPDKNGQEKVVRQRGLSEKVKTDERIKSAGQMVLGKARERERERGAGEE